MSDEFGHGGRLRSISCIVYSINNNWLLLGGAEHINLLPLTDGGKGVFICTVTEESMWRLWLPYSSCWRC